MHKNEERPVTVRPGGVSPESILYAVQDVAWVSVWVCTWGGNIHGRFSLPAVVTLPSASKLSDAGHYLSTLPCHLRRRICVRSKVVKLIPTAMGPLTQFMLRPLYKPRTSPSSRMISVMVRRMDV